MPRKIIESGRKVEVVKMIEKDALPNVVSICVQRVRGNSWVDVEGGRNAASARRGLGGRGCGLFAHEGP